MVVTGAAPKPEIDDIPVSSSLRAAVWEPFVGFLATHRALEMLAFVVLYKLADNLATALIRPFLVQVGFNDFDVGIATATIGIITTFLGVILGGVLTTAIGLGHALWIFGALQIFSNLGYVAVAEVGVNRPLMYAAMGFESFTTGMGTGAFSVLLVRMTQKKFSATQYALFSSLFAVTRILAGPITGVVVDAIGWRDFFLGTIVAGIPGMMLLQRFAPIGTRDPSFEAETARAPRVVTRNGLILRAVVGGTIGWVVAAVSVVLLDAMRVLHRTPEAGFDLAAPLSALIRPGTVADWMQSFGVVLFGLLVALATAATSAARSRGTAEHPRS
jgi:PAT family beta-lactamase induction signal transducer AmpG